MKIVVGLGNYGDKYAYTYHNMGFLCAECLADRLSASFKKRECDSLVAVAYKEGEPVVIAKPLTFMNLSGRAALQLLRKYKADLADLIAVYDDVDIEKGTVRVRQKGSAGTHNGMRNITELLGSGDFPRVRIGIGKPEGHTNLADYVLSEVPKCERSLMREAIERAADEIERLIEG